MATREEDPQAYRRRKQWFMDRAAVERIKREGSRLAVGHMTDQALGEYLVRALLELEESVALQAKPAEMVCVQDALATALELRTRGTQLQMPL